MTWADLDKIAVAKPRPDGRATLVVVDDRTTSAILELPALSTVIAIGRVVRARAAITERYDGRGLVVYRTRELPPTFLVDAVSAAGGVVFDGTREHANPRALATTVQLDGAFVDLAANIRRRYKVGSAGDALDVLEHELRRRPIAKTDASAWWTRMFELCALAGELIRAATPARWVEVPGHTFPLGLDLGPGTATYPGKLAQTLLEGGNGSMRSLVQATKMATSPTAGRPMPLLVHRTAVPIEQCWWSLLLTDEVDAPDVPVIVWVEDHDSVISYPRGTGEPAPELRARALANLANIAIEVESTEMPFGTMVAVSGDFFAAEMILHRPTMERVRTAIGGSPAILVATPARGELIAIDAAVSLVDDNLLNAFLLAVEGGYFRATERDRISSEVIVYTDRPLGRVQSNLMDARRALRRVGVDPDA